ncbi:Alpha/Beta hydrolase protein [Scenedesmus sp. NREL 46B-D3]|nr:Alpha/Beta hydrolase protein [Scenedesmus sp. NREL 46B-D3]
MTHWLLPKRGVQTNADAVKLFCLPQAGMGAAVFHAWSERLAPHVQVLPVELPGHASRMREPRTTDLCQLSCQIVDALASSFTAGRYALFGHSMGAWVAWEVLQELSRRQLPLPLRLYVSGNRAAALSGAEHDLDATRLHTLEADAFWQAFERRYGANPQLAEPKIRAVVYPMLKDDFILVETYKVMTHILLRTHSNVFDSAACLCLLACSPHFKIMHDGTALLCCSTRASCRSTSAATADYRCILFD